jgi:hypothetical protein
VVGLRGIPINHSLGQGYRDSSPLRPHGVPAIIALVRALRKQWGHLCCDDWRVCGTDADRIAGRAVVW